MSNLINLYINNLLNNTPKEIISQYKHNQQHVDIVFEGGLFNGSYESGFMYYLKKMEKLNYIIVDKLSGCSIGSIQGLLYFAKSEDYEFLNRKLYHISYKQLKNHNNVNIFDELFQCIKDILPDNILDKINNRLYISYFNIKIEKQVVKSYYKNIDDLFDTIRKSCSVPIISDNNIFYKKKYMDGLYPYIFNKNKNKRIIYLNISNLSYLFGIFSIKNERKTNIPRILDGIYDTHLFFTTNYTTNMCSYVDKWSILLKTKRLLIEKITRIIVFFLNKYLILYNIISKTDYNEDVFINVIENIYRFCKILYIFFIKTCCI